MAVFKPTIAGIWFDSRRLVTPWRTCREGPHTDDRGPEKERARSISADDRFCAAMENASVEGIKNGDDAPPDVVAADSRVMLRVLFAAVRRPPW
jgi:hypothetical protein